MQVLTIVTIIAIDAIITSITITTKTPNSSLASWSNPSALFSRKSRKCSVAAGVAGPLCSRTRVGCCNTCRNMACGPCTEHAPCCSACAGEDLKSTSICPRKQDSLVISKSMAPGTAPLGRNDQPHWQRKAQSLASYPDTAVLCQRCVCVFDCLRKGLP